MPFVLCRASAIKRAPDREQGSVLQRPRKKMVRLGAGSFLAPRLKDRRELNPSKVEG